MIPRTHFKFKLTACLALFVFAAASISQFSGCNHPLGTPDMTGFAPWEHIPEGDGIRYIETAKAGHSRMPTLVALFEYKDQDSLSRMIDEFQLENDDKYDRTVKLFRADESEFNLLQVDVVYCYSRRRGWI